MKLQLSQLKKLDDCRWLIPRGTKDGMRTDALIYASEKLLKQILTDLSLEQAINVAFLPGIVGRSLAMPDIHQGYGFPIGGVAATDARTGVVSPGGVGFDINCGVRLLRTSLKRDEVAPRIKELVHQLFRDVPCGTGTEGPVLCSLADIEDVLERGGRWPVEERGLGTAHDIEHTESNGALPRANLFGGVGNDTLIGGSGAGMLFGQSGNDRLEGKGGQDFLFGGSEDDILIGGDADDQMFGEAGNDRMIWNPGDDTDLM